MKQSSNAENVFKSIIGNDDKGKEVQKISQKTPNKGRPKAGDISNDDMVIKRTFYITKDIDKKINIYAASNEIDKSEALRYILKMFFNKETEQSM